MAVVGLVGVASADAQPASPDSQPAPPATNGESNVPPPGGLEAQLLAIPTRVPPHVDVDAIGTLGIAQHSEWYGDATYTHADGSDALAIIPGARIAMGTFAFIDVRVPVGYGFQPGAFALGNATAAIGVLPEHHRLSAIALRFAGPTSPRMGDGMQTALALALPRNGDPELFLPHTTSVELVADWRWRGDKSWIQAEGGIAGWWEPSPTGFVPVLRATVAGGVQVERWLDLTASFITRSYVLDDKATEDFVHTLALGATVHDDHGQITLRLEVPIDDSARDENRFLVGLEFRGAR
ncbi:MAG: hypothetical protein QM831_02605 [Kofleriaceae bacterium]